MTIVVDTNLPAGRSLSWLPPLPPLSQTSNWALALVKHPLVCWASKLTVSDDGAVLGGPLHRNKKRNVYLNRH